MMTVSRKALILFIIACTSFLQVAFASNISKGQRILKSQIKFTKPEEVRVRPASLCPSWINAGLDDRQCNRLDVLYRGVYLSGMWIRSAGNEELTIYHVGHEGVRTNIESTSQVTGEVIGDDAVWLVGKFLSSSSDVLILFMPGGGFSPDQGRYSIDVVRLYKMLGAHAVFSLLDFEGDSAAAYFLVHAKSFLDKYSSNYRNISMVGRSGGGWVTTFAAALDRRIECSVSLFGTLPMKVRLPVEGDERNDLGDFEQHGLLLYKSIDYIDLYALAAHGNRRHSLILNEKDDCCFSGAVKGPLMWREFVKAYPDSKGFKWINVPQRSETDHYNIDQEVLSSIKKACPDHWKGR